MTKEEALKLALNVLVNRVDVDHEVINAIRKALAEPEPGGVCGRCGGWVCDPVLAQPEHEPVAYQDIAEKCRLETVPAKGTLLHTSPPASKSWQGLTGEGIDKLADMHRKE